MPINRRFRSYAGFYPCYRSLHANRTCRRLHFLGALLAIGCLAAAARNGNGGWLAGAPVAGCGLARIGHCGFEHTRPATFARPLYCLAGDWAMLGDILRGRIRFRGAEWPAGWPRSRRRGHCTA